MKVPVVGILLGLLMAFLIGQVRAHDAVHPELNSYFNNLKSSGGALCCSGNDGTVLADVDWETKDGHYRVRIDGQWIAVEDSAVVTVPNRAGQTMVWPVPGENGGVWIRCFMPGSMT